MVNVQAKYSIKSTKQYQNYLFAIKSIIVFVILFLYIHCIPRQVEPAYIECGNGTAAMQVSQVNLFELAQLG